MEKDRNYALDSLRGFASIGVCIRHYLHFIDFPQFISAPFSNALIICYKLGGLFVDFFFCLSGFIFFCYYAEKISSREVKFKEFVILRISRLYPLILITLVITSILQYTLFINQGKFFIYHNNNYFTFFTNLCFLQRGFFGGDFSFNGPTWSLAIEFWLYLIFFYLSYSYPKQLGFLAPLISLLFFTAYSNDIRFGMIIFSADFERGLSNFFLGGTLYYCVKYLKDNFDSYLNFIGFTAFFLSVTGYVLTHLTLSSNPHSLIQDPFEDFFLSFSMIIHPGLILSLSISPVLNKFFSNKLFGFFGDISYSIYLWHVPLQLFIYILFFKYNINLQLHTYRTFVLYFLALFALSYLSYKFLEIPAKKMIRSKLLTKDNVKTPPIYLQKVI
ncbi:putative O-acyltransferase [Candidatus Phycorickettsia trachydisci]|uniref:Putative O-acyltransferase n=1 Tax=Candidatus Phycorickettsia trachydisci TaxID=2115978 RepID=A0A2P1P8V8_9RICK|nr:acyltransferase [Candidatus Phycorickettsia trachydisci]AVP87696.1 putative O-acyltransferase [Candidatus Phycorickettsia trachydisci]